jgi:hypothetical protein
MALFWLAGLSAVAATLRFNQGLEISSERNSRRDLKGWPHGRKKRSGAFFGTTNGVADFQPQVEFGRFARFSCGR